MRKPPAAVFVLLGTSFQGLVYSGLSISSALHDERRGWRDGRPGPVNRACLPAIAGGLAFIAWATVGHHRAAGGETPVTSNPDYLAEGGAYAVSRNPLYLGGLTTWFGWAGFLGSRRAAAAGALLATGLATLGIPFEERRLGRAFGESYLAYRRRVPRWL